MDERIKIIAYNRGEDDAFYEQFSDEIPQEEFSEKEVAKSKGIIKGFCDYLKSSKFMDDCNRKAKQFHVSPKKVAKTYVAKVAGTVGDMLDIAVDTAELGATGLIRLLSNVLCSAVSLICSVARGIFKFFTCGYTATA